MHSEGIVNNATSAHKMRGEHSANTHETFRQA